MNKWLELLIGLVLVIVPIVVAINSVAWGWGDWGRSTIEFLRGGIVIGVILIGLLFLMLGISDLKS